MASPNSVEGDLSRDKILIRFSSWNVIIHVGPIELLNISLVCPIRASNFYHITDLSLRASITDLVFSHPSFDQLRHFDLAYWEPWELDGLLPKQAGHFPGRFWSCASRTRGRSRIDPLGGTQSFRLGRPMGAAHRNLHSDDCCCGHSGHPRGHTKDFDTNCTSILLSTVMLSQICTNLPMIITVAMLLIWQ